MSEIPSNSKKPAVSFDEYGNIVTNEKPANKLVERMKGIQSLTTWAIRGIRRGYYLPVDPEQVKKNLEDMKARVDASQEVTVAPDGTLQPKQK